MRNLGCFVSCAGGLENGVKNGEALGINTIMIHPTPPQRWNSKPFEEEKMQALKDALDQSEIVKRIHMHGIYLINLSSPDKQKFYLAKMSIVNYLELAEFVDSPGVVFHTGSFKDIEPEEGFKRVAYGVDWIVEHAKSSKPLFLEVAAASGNVIGSKFQDLAKIKDLVKNPDRVQFCLDTQHMWASGYDIKNDLDGVVDQIEKILGLDNVICVHFNDSKTEFNSKRDRHENLGEGLIGEDAMKAFLNHPKLKKLDFVMETPDVKKVESAEKEVKKLLSWAK